ncbi:uncharacterized protein LOC119681624 [Teleopsis dalmanni]|nr:uncharacterized protein LOC119681624 [Teleopsis dalmanni]
MQNVKNFLQNNVHRRDKDIVPHIVRSFETCLSNIQSHMHAAGIKMYPRLKEGCTPYASMVYGCVNAETFLNCPAKMWRNERNCNLAKSFALQCNPLPHVPLPLI